ncbi:exoprotein [Erythrobacter sp. QSSC1-22B]|uniref:intermembrane phospholipid transport protein YdbH family protein n=1 Tax=Erythrobacter sp. QSSC1-22B TaxID=1860125 RepID=UPI0008050AA0|nr:YdbH domain-containing protein [Erythrobacter sp. QSSC1-22B]OBX19035.1 exoprotein [Erythrobacter sp. QSSC1-22B]
MDGVDTQVTAEADQPREYRSRWRKKRWLGPLGIVLAMLLAALGAWLMRERIAGDIIEDQLALYDIPASYDIAQIGAQSQILTNVVLGDPARPDFTAERVELHLRHRFGTPTIERVILVKPRLFGVLRGTTPSFGTLDPLIFAETDGEPGLPELDVAIRDGRGLLESAYGPIGFKLDGEGRIDDGFSGIFAATAPSLDLPDCALRGASAYGSLTTSAGEPRFAGPVRLGSADCGGITLAQFAARVRAKASPDLEDFSGRASVRSNRIAAQTIAANGLDGTFRASWRDGVLASSHSLALRGVSTPQLSGALLTLDGTARAESALENASWQGDVEANGLRPGRQTEAALAGLAETGAGTLVEPIARRIAAALRNEARGSAFTSDLTARKRGERLSVFMSQAELRGGRGRRLASFSQVEASRTGEGSARYSGNFAMSGSGLPSVNGRMESGAGGDLVFRMAMARYEASGSSLAIPRLTLAQGADGAFGFSGEAVLSGALPGGSARELQLPLSGRWAPGGSLALWRECTDIRFEQLQFSGLRLDRQSLTLCPPPGSAIVENGPRGLRIAAGAPRLSLTGMLGGTPIRLATGAVGFAYPGAMTARQIDVVLGPEETATRFAIADLDARFGDAIAGSFADADVTIEAVPLDIRGTRGKWRYADGRLDMTGGSFTLLDRAEPDRFEPLEARDATLSLVDNLITAFAELRHPGSDRVVTAADIRHDLSTGRGDADLAVAGLQFDRQLQPDDLSRLALGVVANADGIMAGSGRVAWGENGVTSSGVFATNDFDFAAAFGPVRGASGTIVFTDLLSLTTAPNQSIRVASVNPGIEVIDGTFQFELRDWTMLSVEGGSWPFMGGDLILREVDLNFGIKEERRYVFEVVGLNAGVFVDGMDIGNLAATGIFDGTIPIVFDASGNGRIDDGVLISRPPGGNISYVGELTYEDLSPMANFAFDALRSLDYSQMRLLMDGPLTGEIVTRVRFDGVSQGEGTSNNFITRRLARLPLQFRINIRAQFYQLINSMKSLYDPAAVRDPRGLGLVSDDGTRLLRREITGEEAGPEIDPGDPFAADPGEPTIQEQESE